MRKHCEIGYNMLIRIPFLRDARKSCWRTRNVFDARLPARPEGRRHSAGIPHIHHCGIPLMPMISDRRTASFASFACARRNQALLGYAVRSRVVDVLCPSRGHCWSCRENLGSPFRLAHLKNL